MQAEINGTTIRIVSSGNGLERAAFDFNSGPSTGHLHVYVTSVFQDTGRQIYACTDKPLTKEQIIGLDHLYAEVKGAIDAERDELRAKLLGPDGMKFIAERQAGNLDSQTASSDIARALDLDGWRGNTNWGEVKQAISMLHKAAVELVKADLIKRGLEVRDAKAEAK